MNGSTLARQPRRPRDRVRGVRLHGRTLGGGRDVGMLNTPHRAPWLGIPAAIVTLDLVSYCWHRANHRIPILWRFHQVHHSDPTFTTSTGVRFHPGELLLSLPLRLTAVAVVGVSVEAVLVFEIMFTIANFLEHGDIDLPLPFERLMGRVLHHAGAPPAAPHEDRPRPGHQLRHHLFDLGSTLRHVRRERLRDSIETGLPGLGSVDPAPRLHAAAPADGSVATASLLRLLGSSCPGC